jgi:hypothetical protein
MPETLNLAQKQNLNRKIEPFTLKEGIVCRVGQGNRMHRCLTTSETQIVLEELYEIVVGGHFVVEITLKKILDVRYWWPTLFKDIHDFCGSCDSCQKIRRLKTMFLAKLVTTLLKEPFMKWGLYFIGLIKLIGRLTKKNTFC